jgi:hypothetical protein
VNSENGQPVINENLTFYEFVSNNNLTKISGKTDNNGIFRFPATKNNDYYRTFLIRQPKTNDVQIMEVYGERGYNSDRTKKQNKARHRFSQTEQFTDRDRRFILKSLIHSVIKK